ncbi:hypothetical protein ACLMJK_002626 [Lecanora helva]
MNQKSVSKGVEAPSDQSAEEVSKEDPSLPRRIVASASGLAQSAVAPPSVAESAGSLASLNSEASKGLPHFSSENGEGSSSVLSSRVHPDEGRAEASSTGQSFRSLSPNATSTAQSAFDEFTAGYKGLDAALLLNEKVKESLASSEKEDRPVLRGVSYQNRGGSASSDAKIFGALAGIDRNARAKHLLSMDFEKPVKDGAEVVALLSDPKFSVEDDPANTWDGDLDDSENTNSFLVSPDNQSDGSTTFPAHSTTHPLGLMPDFGSHHDGLIGTIPEYGEVKPWMDILNRYHDEVWGDLLPLVREAREEVRKATASEEGTSQDRPAVRRLRMLLGQIQLPAS